MTEEKSGTALLNQNLNDIKAAIPTEEIVASNPSQKSWKGILIAILVILLISGIIMIAIYYTSQEIFHGSKTTNFGSKFTFRDFFYGRGLHKFIVIQWIGYDRLSYVNEVGERKLLNLNTMNETDVIMRSYLEEKKAFASSMSLSQDGELLYIFYNQSANYRHSATAQHTVYNLKNKEVNTDIGPVPLSALQNAVWSPQGHRLIFVYDNNIYYTDNPLDNSKLISVTKDLPQSPYISYGVADWLYEEEILKDSSALWWSPSGTNIAFMSFNDEQVQSYKISIFGTHDKLYGSFLDVKYPKAGQVPRSKNPEVELFVYQIDAKKTYKIPVPSNIPGDHYICFVKWIDDDHLLTAWSNREQNESWLSIAQNWKDGKAIESWTVYNEKVSNGWVNLLKQTSDDPVMLPNKRKLYIILNRVVWNTEYRNIAELTLSYTPNTLAARKWVVSADFDFTDIVYFDKTKGLLYFSAILRNDPKELHLYKADIITGQFKCLSCEDKNCSYNQFTFSPKGDYAVHSCLGPSVPTFYLMKLNQNDTFSRMKLLINNTEFKEMIASRAMPKTEYQRITITLNTTQKVELETKLLLPIQLNKEHVTQYPLLLYVYGGPSSQAVTKKFTLDWCTYLTSSLGVIVLQVDGRGTLNRGRQFERAVYKNLGNIEIHDQLKATMEISKYHFINKSQIGAYGWSYGGFAVGQLMGNSENKLIRCGVSVAPVTSFDYYDTAYTERYLGLKESNPLAYQQTDISRSASNFLNKKYLLIHGTRDDNVHFLNSARLIRALVDSDYDFDVMVYPDEAHTLLGGRTHINVFRKITTFLLNCYNKTSIDYDINLFQ